MPSKSTLKSIRALKLKKYRANTGKFLVEGIKSVKEVLASDMKVDHVLVTEDFASQITHENREIVGKNELKEVSNLSTNESCIAVVSMHVTDHRILDKEICIYLDGITDPGNLGTIVRSLDWFGYNQVFCSLDTVDYYNSKTVMATMGSFTRIKPTYIDLSELANELKGSRLYGMSLEGTPIRKVQIEAPAIIIMGSESHGIRKETDQLLDERISIPGKGRAESLNVAMATTLILYDLSIR